MNVGRVTIALLIGLAAAACTAPATASNAPSPSVAASSGVELGEQQQHEAGAVTIAASWIVGTSSAQVAMNTHSVDLDGFDLKDLARARLDGGAWVTPTAWDAPRGGHHRTGTLAFGTLAPADLASARVVELEVRDVAVSSHLLRWERTR